MKIDYRDGEFIIDGECRPVFIGFDQYGLSVTVEALDRLGSPEKPVHICNHHIYGVGDTWHERLRACWRAAKYVWNLPRGKGKAAILLGDGGGPLTHLPMP